MQVEQTRIALESFTHGPIFGVIAILLQMTGFVLMIKYYRKPTLDEVHKLLDKEKTKHPDDMKYESDIDLEPFMVDGRSDTMRVPKSVSNYFEFRRKLPLFLILFGLFMQIMPLIS